MVPNPFSWLRNLGGGKDEAPPEDRPDDSRAVSAADMRRLGWISEAQAQVAAQALDDLKSVIQKAGWKLAPQFRKDAITFLAPDGKVPFVITFRGDQVGFFVCVPSDENPVAVAEVPREFDEKLAEGAYRGFVLSGRKLKLQRYVSVLSNSVRLGNCRS